MFLEKTYCCWLFIFLLIWASNIKFYSPPLSCRDFKGLNGRILKILSYKTKTICMVETNRSKRVNFILSFGWTDPLMSDDITALTQVMTPSCSCCIHYLSVCSAVTVIITFPLCLLMVFSPSLRLSLSLRLPLTCLPQTQNQQRDMFAIHSLRPYVKIGVLLSQQTPPSNLHAD